MPEYTFKLMGTFDDRGRKEIEIKEEFTVEQVKAIVKREFKMPPSIIISLLVNGSSLSDGTRWASVSAIPRKTVINVIGTR
jgi:hypothetical protein